MIYIALWLAAAFLFPLIWRSKGRSYWLGFAVSLIMPLAGLVIGLVIPKREPGEGF